MTSLKLLQAIVTKNESFTKILLKREYYCLIINRLQLKNYSAQHQTKFDPYDNLNIHKSSMFKQFSTSNNQGEIDFEQACNETLESLCEYFEQIVEDNPHLENPDILFSDGVLTIQLGEPYGTYVINRQTPNKQIWLSSPVSGPKRYDFNGTKWIYKHDGVSLHELLTSELSKEYSFNVNFSKCIFSGLEYILVSRVNNVDDKKFVRLVDRMIRDFEPNRLSSFSELELASMEKALKLNSNECQCLLNCLSQLLKEVISDVTKPLILKNVLSKLFLLNEKKVELFCECWSTNAEQVVSRLQQNLTHSYRLKDVNWTLNISSNVGLGIELSDPEPRCLIELKVEDTHYHNEPKIKEINLDLDEKELKKLYNTLEAIQVKLDSL